jgi:serine protease
MAQDPEVAWAVPNTRERRLQAAGSPPSDPFFGSQWWLQPVSGSDGVSIAQRLRGVPGFQTAWTSVTTGSSDTAVAVLDNGIVSHPDLGGKVVAGYDMVADTAFSNDGDGRDADPSDPGDWVDSTDLARPEYDGCVIENSSWHGTAIAGMLAANVNNGEGGASINWPGRVLAVRVAAKCGADVADIVDGMRWVAGLEVCRRDDGAGQCLETLPAVATPRARVVNISFGGTGSCDAYQDTIDALRARGVVVVAAAGNEYTAPTRPAKCAGVIGVAALNRDGFKSTYSNFGSSLKLATVGGDDDDGAWGAAAGANSQADSGLLAASNSGDRGPGASGYASYFGTSFSTPVVAGAVGLMLAVNPNLSADQIEQGLRLSARPHVTSSLPGVAACSEANPGRCLCTTATCGAGILDAAQALAYAANPGTYERPNWPTVSIDSADLRAAAAAGPDRPGNPTEPPAGGGNEGGGGGGGAMSAWWLLALGAAVVGRAKRTPRIRLCRSAGVAPSRGNGVSRSRGGPISVARRPTSRCQAGTRRP